MKYYKNIIQILVENAHKYPNKIIFEDKESAITYQEFVEKSRMVGLYISSRVQGYNQPIAVFADKNVNALIMMFGILFSGNFYCILDIKSPTSRIENILNTLQPVGIVSDEEGVPEIIYEYENYFDLNDVIQYNVNNEEMYFYDKLVDTDPIYALFTSGSTGNPKGAVISHKSVIAYATSVINTFGIDSSTVFGNQTPFYFSMSVLDIYTTIIAGASMYIIPKSTFAFPKKLVQTLNEKKVNTIYWVPTAMGIITRFRTFEKIIPSYLKLVMFAGETMPVKCIAYWQDNLKDVVFANLFGPTEITDTCTYHILKRKYNLDESIPIGKSFSNCEVFIIKEDNTLAAPGEDGELYVKGSFVGMGYYNVDEITQKAFVQNPLNAHYPEIVYKTGDRVRYNEEGELLYLGRMDFQIKHMGYRIELGEIEKVCYAIESINSCACVYDVNSDNIVLFVESKQTEEQLIDAIKAKLPKYMVPQRVINLKRIPINANGKTDRTLLKKNLEVYYAGEIN